MDKALQRQSFLFSFLISCVLILAPFYAQQSLGGEGLAIPYNNWVWIFAIAVISSGIFQIILNKKIRLPKYWLTIAALPISFIVSSFINESVKPTQWLFTIGYIVGGFLFFIALFQFSLKRRHIENILYGICAAATAHSLIALCQVSGWYPTSYIPRTADNAPISIFQQVNVHATFLITAFIITLYLAGSPSSINRHHLSKALLIVTLFSTTAILLAISSRTALVAFIVSTPLILIARHYYFKRRLKLSLVLFIAFSLGLSAGAYLSQGFARYETKLDTQKAHARTYIYDLSWQVFKQAPYFGHGLGSFEQVFQEAKINYQHSSKMGAARYSHPHNELLYWMIEGGVSSLIGIFIAFFGTALALIKLGWRRALSYSALLFPITFHTQVELPFYLSSALWFLWLTLLFFVHSHQSKSINVCISKATERLVVISSTLIGTAVIGFLLHTTVSSQGIINYLRSPQQSFIHLNSASQNLYYQRLSYHLKMTSLLYRDIAQGTNELTPLFIQWAQQYTKSRPITSTINNLALAYYYLGDREKALYTIRRAAKMYPATKTISNRLKDIEDNRAIQDFTQKIQIRVEPSQALDTTLHQDL